ncbi:MAG TPA: hypothetical protein VGL86_06075 [Polyangia bacterium]|jgi:hypothetical protein
MDAIIHDSDGGLALASCGAVYISILRRPLTLDGLARMTRQSKRIYELHRGRCASMAIIEPSAADAASKEVREKSAELARAHPILGAAIVIEGSGFRPAATRTLVAGMYLVTRKEYPHKIVSTPAEAAAWLVPILAQAGVLQSSNELILAAEATRAALTRAA